MNENSFINQKEEAVRRMREMNLKSQPQKAETTPNANKEPLKNTNPDNSLFAGLNIPFLNNIKSDSDSALILGILLLLLSEKADKKLLFALIYILL